MFVTFNVISLCYVIFGTIGVLSDDNHNSNLFIVLLCLFIVNICLGIYICVFEVKGNFLLLTQRSCHIILSSILAGYFLFCRSLVGDCSIDTPFITNWSCNPQYVSNTLPVDTMLILMLVPLIYASIFENAISWGVLLSSWIITISWLVICIILFKAYNSTFAVIFYAPLSLLLLYQNNLHHKKLCNIIDDKNNEIIKVKLETESTKSIQDNMISNVTHDLKTVSKIYDYIILRAIINK